MAVKFRDYYEVLGVPRHASADDIQRAYRKLARQHHPDLKPAAERGAAAERFKEINEAYEVLRDPGKRKKYDALGENWRGGQEFTPPPGYGPGAGGPAVEWGDGGDPGDFSDFFDSLFGRASGGPRTGRSRRARTPQRGHDVEAEMSITLEESLNGGRRRLTFDGGRTLDVEIPRGARDGTVLRLQGQGGAGPAGKPGGDLYLHLHLAPHPEGGHFREIFRDPRQTEGRAASTAIYFLLAAGERSHWHRVDAAEVWHFYAGAPLALEIAQNEKNSPERIVLGIALAEGQRPQIVVPARAWQAAESLGRWTLVGCTVAPGFEFAGFELAPKGFRPNSSS